jgi:RimJ/RimL family protein N-acetyltransferase
MSEEKDGGWLSVATEHAFHKRVVSIFQMMKFEFHKCPNELMIPVLHNGKVVAHLRPVPFQLEGVASEDAKLITDWRNQYREIFLTWFTATEERTRKWLTEQVIAKNDRILFMIQNLDGMPFGHMGLANFDFRNKICEYDNIVKGMGVGLPMIMTFAGRALLGWAFSELGVKRVFVRVFSDNTPAVKLYERCGFRPVKKVPLKRIREGDCIYWIETEEPSTVVERYLSYMVLADIQLSKEEL